MGLTWLAGQGASFPPEGQLSCAPTPPHACLSAATSGPFLRHFCLHSLSCLEREKKERKKKKTKVITARYMHKVKNTKGI